MMSEDKQKKYKEEIPKKINEESISEHFATEFGRMGFDEYTEYQDSSNPPRKPKRSLLDHWYED